jgi:hypothetical protein
MTSPLPGGKASSRDLRFDSLRGLMIVCMTINHLPSSLRAFTDETLGIFSSAEGFVFLSGLLIGLVYTRRLRRDGPTELRQAVVQRASRIYAWHVTAFLTALLAVQLCSWLSGFCSWASPPLFYAHPWLAAVLGSAMLYQPGLLDILPMYCVFVLLVPPVLNALEAGKRWQVLGWSFLAWFIVQWIPPIDGAPLYPVHVGSFNIFAWQFLFICGMAIGHDRLTDPRPQMSFRPLLLLGAIGIAVYGYGVQRLHWRPDCPEWLFGAMLNKPNLGALRLADFGMAAYLVGMIGGRWPKLVTWRPLAFLGQHSLVVVAAQSVLVLILIQFDGLFATTLRDHLVAAGAIAFLFATAWVHQSLTGKKPALVRPRQMPTLPVSRPHDVPAA